MQGWKTVNLMTTYLQFLPLFIPLFLIVLQVKEIFTEKPASKIFIISIRNKSHKLHFQAGRKLGMKVRRFDPITELSKGQNLL